MTDRLRTWTLYDPGENEPIAANGPAFYGLDERDGIRVVEWDREKAVPVIIDAMGSVARVWPASTSERVAEAIFDALDRQGADHD